jgi:hypothetical protein
MAGTYGVDMIQIAVAATAISLQRAVMVAVNSDGHLIGARPLSEAVRQSDSQTLQARVKSVLAHNQYLRGLGATDGTCPTIAPVAAAEL